MQEVHEKSPRRTMESLNQSHKNFLSDGGGDIKKAKFFENVIDEPLFNVPINQVSTQHALYCKQTWCFKTICRISFLDDLFQ